MTVGWNVVGVSRDRRSALASGSSRCSRSGSTRSSVGVGSVVIAATIADQTADEGTR